MSIARVPMVLRDDLEMVGYILAGGCFDFERWAEARGGKPSVPSGRLVGG